MSIPPPPKTQALCPETKYKVPPLDGSLTVPEIYEWHAKHNASHGLFVYARDDGTKRTISCKEGANAFSVAANHVHSLTGGKSGEVVAILSPSESISYFTLIIGILRANCVAFPISPRNSAAAVAHLLRKVSVKHLLVGREQAMTDLANKTFEILEQERQSIELPTLSPIPLFEDLYLQANGTPKGMNYNRQSHDVAMYLHSSGSTAFPKPIPWTHRRMVEHSLTLWFGDRDQCDKVWSIAANPMYHGTGVLGLIWGVSCGITISVFEPKSPPQIPTADELFRSAKTTDTDILFCVPAFLEAWSCHPEYVQWLASRDGVVWGGAPLNKEIGDYLTREGVELFILYGATETGSVTPLIPATVDSEWQYFPISRFLTVEMLPYDENSNTYEVVVLATPHSIPSVINTKIRGQDAYATSDLLVPHPTKSGLWRVHGRSDDQIMHSTGEKTNPGPLENLMNQHPKVQSAVMFGRGHFQAGIVVDPLPEFKFDPSDLKKLAEFRNDLWPTVEQMNEYAPQHSRLFKEMVMVSKPSKPFTYTAKNTARRQAIIHDYEEEIEELYEVVAESTQSLIPAPETWDRWTTLDFVRKVVQQVLQSRKPFQDDQDIFERGCDSLQATWIRNSLLRAVRESAELDTRKTTINFVYNHPTISSLATYVLQMARGEDDAKQQDDVNHKILEMLALVKKYSSKLPAPRTSSLFNPSPSQHDVVILTGSTGAIGSHVLLALALDPGVRQIYALNRRSGRHSLRDRHVSAFVERGLPVEVLDSEKITLLEVDFTEEFFGVSAEVYEQMQSTVTCIIHNAWRVDFNLSLKSFESNIRGIRTLINFALTSRLLPKFVFVSSLGVLRNTSDLARPILEQEVTAATALGMGYSESKWVGEMVVGEVRKSSGLPTLVIRVGQVTGASNGAWNPKEWVPSLVQASTKLGCLPDFDSEKIVSWVSAKDTGEAIAVAARHTSSDIAFAHLVHPRPAPWKTILDSLSSALGLAATSYGDWLQRLETYSIDHPHELNASNIIPFFQAIEGSSWDKECFGLPPVDITQALSITMMKGVNSPAFNTLGKSDVESWIGYWKRVGIL